jgi:tyrosinase
MILLHVSLEWLRYRVMSDAHDVKHSPIFNADPWVGFGSFPDASTNFELSNGAFCDIIRAYPVVHHIQRNYTLRVRFASFPWSEFLILNLHYQPWETQVFSWPFDLPEKEGNLTQTAAEYLKLTTGFTGNFTAFQAYMDGFRLQGMHPAAHIVRHSRQQLTIVRR